VAHTRSAKKRIKTSEKARIRNRFFKGIMRSSIKKFNELLESKDAAKAQEALPALVKTISKVASKGVIHKNQASRRISRMTSAVHKLVKG